MPDLFCDFLTYLGLSFPVCEMGSYSVLLTSAGKKKQMKIAPGKAASYLTPGRAWWGAVPTDHHSHPCLPPASEPHGETNKAATCSDLDFSELRLIEIEDSVPQS